MSVASSFNDPAVRELLAMLSKAGRERLCADVTKSPPLRVGRRSGNRFWGPEDGSTRLNGRSSARQGWRKCHWPGYPHILSMKHLTGAVLGGGHLGSPGSSRPFSTNVNRGLYAN